MKKMWLVLLAGVLIMTASTSLIARELDDEFLRATRSGKVEEIKMLLDKGANIEAKTDSEGFTALILAAEWGHPDIVKLLLDKGANIEARSGGNGNDVSEGYTALIRAVINGETAIVKLLLDKGSDPRVKDGLGETALNKAEQLRKTEIADMLRAALSPKGAQMADPRQMLELYITELRKVPNDAFLRERIIKHVQTMKPAPAMPEEARRHYVMAKTLFDGAKKPEDFNDSIAEFKDALIVTPWWPEANRDLGLALEAAQRYDEAISYVKLYMATNPGDDRTRAAQDEIYKIEAKQKLSGKAASEKVAEQEQKKKQEEKARTESVEGTWCSFLWGSCRPESAGLMKIQRQAGGGWTIEFPNWNQMYAFDTRQNDRSISFTRTVRGSDPELNTDYLSLTVSADGTRLRGTIKSVSISGNRPRWVTEECEYVRQ